MQTKFFRSHLEPIREGLTLEETWKGEDRGLIKCWEVGRELREKDPDLMRRALDGELPVLVWKGGVAKKNQIEKKYGSYNYLAQWQGLRGEDLDIDLSTDVDRVCKKTGMRIIYTGNVEKYGDN